MNTEELNELRDKALIVAIERGEKAELDHIMDSITDGHIPPHALITAIKKIQSNTHEEDWDIVYSMLARTSEAIMRQVHTLIFDDPDITINPIIYLRSIYLLRTQYGGRNIPVKKLYELLELTTHQGRESGQIDIQLAITKLNKYKDSLDPAGSL